MSESIELCEWLVAELKNEFPAGDLENTVFRSIRRDYLPLTDLTTGAKPQLFVCVGNSRTSRLDRRKPTEHGLEIVMQYKLVGTRDSDKDRPVMDALVETFENVRDFVRDRNLRVAPDRSYLFRAAEFDPIFDPDRLQRREYLGILGVEYLKTGR